MSPASTIAHYRIISKAGESGMVYADRPSSPVTRIDRRAVDGAGAGEFLGEDAHQPSLMDWSPDGKCPLYGTPGAEVDTEFAQLMDFTGTPPDAKRVNCRGSLSGARISPDGRWLAFSTVEGASERIFVMPFPAGGAIQEIGSSGSSPRWTNGKELLYGSSTRKSMAMPIEGGDVLRTGTPQALFDLPYKNNYYATADGSRFLARTPIDGAATPPVEIVTNWPALLHKAGESA